MSPFDLEATFHCEECLLTTGHSLFIKLMGLHAATFVTSLSEDQNMQKTWPNASPQRLLLVYFLDSLAHGGGGEDEHVGCLTDPLPVFSAKGHCEQLWRKQWNPLFVVANLAFPLLTTVSPTLQGALKDGIGEAVVASHAWTIWVSISWRLPEQNPVGPKGSWSCSTPSCKSCAQSRRCEKVSSGTWSWKSGSFSQPPEGRPGMSDVSPLSRISGLSFDSTLLSPLLFICLVLLLFLFYLFFCLILYRENWLQNHLWCPNDPGS